MRALGATVRVLRPVPNVLGFDDGRVPGGRVHGLLDETAGRSAACGVSGRESCSARALH